MKTSILSLVLSALSLSSVQAAPTADTDVPAKHGWNTWNSGNTCNDKTMKIRKDFDTMAPEERKAYTSAINCLRKLPSQLDQTLYPAATDRFMDYAVIHVGKTQKVHLSGFFLTWHRYYLWLFEQDLQEKCGYTGSFPYWNWPTTVDNMKGSPIFNGDEYSMSGDGLYTGNTPIVLSPNFVLPHGTGGGCVTTGPFAGMNTTMAPIPINYVLEGLPLPPTTYNLNSTCLTRDLNPFVAKTWLNETAVQAALQAPSVGAFADGVNGILGGGALGLHSAAHFAIGAPLSNLFVSPMDPIWYPLHTMLDNVYTSWQARHPELAMSVFGTETAVNMPPSANVTLDTVHPDWGYFGTEAFTMRDLISTTAGPFCYKYDGVL